MSQTRRLAAILAAHVAGYSRLMGADEEGTLERLKVLRRELVDPKIAEHRGRIAYTLAYLGEDVGAMIALANRAMALNPSYVRGWYVSAILQLIAGNADLAIEHIERSLRLSPRDYFGVPTMIIGLAHFLGRRFELAAQNFKLALRQVPDWPSSYRFLAACYAHLAHLEEARAVIEQLRKMGAAIVPHQAFPIPKVHELLISGLRLAAGEET
jgi:adenylate cyclase